MAKSVRSKWKKRMAKAKTEACRPQMLANIEKLSNKLQLCAQNKLSKLPMEDPSGNFFHEHPGVDATKPLKLAKFSTNVRKGLRGFEGNADGTTGITSIKKTQAKYHALPGQKKDAEEDDDEAVATAEETGVTSMGGFVNDSDDDVPQLTEGKQKMKILPKAADLKKPGGKKQKDSGAHTRLAAGGRRAKKQ